MHPLPLPLRVPRLLALVAVLVLAGLAAAGPARAGVANLGLPGATDNPLEGVEWGTFHSPTRVASTEPPSAYFNTTRNRADRADFGKLLRTPRFRWFGSWIPLHDRGRGATLKWGVYRTARTYIETVQQGDPDKLVPIGIFRLEPFEREVDDYVPSAAQRREYRRWILEFARGIRDSNARVVLLLQPDMPLALKQPRGARTHIQDIAWTAKVFGDLRYTTTYIDAGASDWDPPETMAKLLRDSGVRHVRGFALNLTHYSSTEDNVAYGKRIVAGLARRGLPDKHFVVSTSMNGRPFTFQSHERVFKAGTICRDARDRHCVTLGRPPTTRTGTPAADAFLWLARPWYNNATVRTYGEMLKIIRTSPYFGNGASARRSARRSRVRARALP